MCETLLSKLNTPEVKEQKETTVDKDRDTETDNYYNEDINPLEHTVVSDATGLAIHFNTQSSARRLRHRCRLLEF